MFSFCFGCLLYVGGSLCFVFVGFRSLSVCCLLCCVFLFSFVVLLFVVDVCCSCLCSCLYCVVWCVFLVLLYIFLCDFPFYEVCCMFVCVILFLLVCVLRLGVCYCLYMLCCALLCMLFRVGCVHVVVFCMTPVLIRHIVVVRCSLFFKPGLFKLFLLCCHVVFVFLLCVCL